MSQIKKPQSNKNPGFVAKFINQIMGVIVFILLAWVVTLSIVGIYSYYKGINFTFILLEKNILLQATLLQQHSYSVLISTTQAITQWALSSCDWLKALPTIHTIHTHNFTLNKSLTNLAHPISFVGMAIILLSALIGLKLLVIILSIPLLMLFLFTGLVDGLVLREVRRYSNGRESSLIYHQWRRLLKPVLLVGYGVYLICLYPVNPMYILLPVTVLAACVVAVMIKHYKKYL